MRKFLQEEAVALASQEELNILLVSAIESRSPFVEGYIEMLLDRGASAHAVHPQTREPVLHMALNRRLQRVVNILSDRLDHFEDVDGDGNTGLMRAIIVRDGLSFATLGLRGAGLDHRNNSNESVCSLIEKITTPKIKAKMQTIYENIKSDRCASAALAMKPEVVAQQSPDKAIEGGAMKFAQSSVAAAARRAAKEAAYQARLRRQTEERAARQLKQTETEVKIAARKRQILEEQERRAAAANAPAPRFFDDRSKETKSRRVAPMTNSFPWGPPARWQCRQFTRIRPMSTPGREL